MKLRTSYFNPTAFRKNITRFLPLWGLYTLLLLLVLLLICDSGSYEVPSSIAETVPLFGVANLVYAFLCAAVLFGDLFQSRLCNALHAMPLRREGWFLTNVAAGLSFSLAPTLLCAVLGTLALVSSPVDGAWQIPWLVFAAANMQFVFFFGVAVLSMFCAGNRLASLLVYAIVNFFAMLVYWMVDTLYLPMLESVLLQQESFFPFSPVVRICSGEYLTVSYVHDNYYFPIDGSWAFSDGWGYLGICTGLGAVLLGVSLLLYRRRALECAGDFLAVKPLEPVFLVIYSLAIGCVFQMVQTAFGTHLIVAPLLFVGIAVGWFTGWMLLRRTVKIFNKKTVLGCVAILVCMGLSLVFTAVDLLGITRWVPKAENVRMVTLSGYQYDSDRLKLTEEDEIADILLAHADAIRGREPAHYTAPIDIPYIHFTLTYTLRSGATAQRQYSAPADSEAAALLKPYFSSFEYIFGVEAEPEELVNMLTEVDWSSSFTDKDMILQLLQAMEKDCAEGTLAQRPGYHGDFSHSITLAFGFIPDPGQSTAIQRYCSVEVYPDSTHTMQYLTDSGLLEKYSEYYGKWG